MTKIWFFHTSGEAYDASQCRDEIHGGDVLIATKEEIVGFLCQAWPVAVTEKTGAFHAIAGNITMNDFAWKHSEKDHIDYVTSYKIAREVIANLNGSTK